MKTREELLKEFEPIPEGSLTISSSGIKAEVKKILSAPTKEQMECPYCHEPFLDLSGQSVDEMFPEAAYCNFEKDGLNYGAGEFEDGDDRTVHVNFCPICGRKQGDD